MSVKLPFASAVVEIDVPETVTVTPDAALAATLDMRRAERLEAVTPEIVPRIVVPVDAATVAGAAAVLGAVGDPL